MVPVGASGVDGLGVQIHVRFDKSLVWCLEIAFTNQERIEARRAVRV